MLLEGEDRIEAALLMDNIVVSVDGVDQETAEKYQQGTDFDQSPAEPHRADPRHATHADERRTERDFR